MACRGCRPDHASTWYINFDVSVCTKVRYCVSAEVAHRSRRTTTVGNWIEVDVAYMKPFVGYWTIVRTWQTDGQTDRSSCAHAAREQLRQSGTKRLMKNAFLTGRRGRRSTRNRRHWRCCRNVKSRRSKCTALRVWSLAHARTTQTFTQLPLTSKRRSITPPKPDDVTRRNSLFCSVSSLCFMYVSPCNRRRCWKQFMPF